MTFAKPISDLAIEAARTGTFGLRDVFELTATMIHEASSLQADALQTELLALEEIPVTDSSPLSNDLWQKLEQMGQSFWEIRSAGNTFLNGDNFRLKTVFYDHLAATFKKAVEASNDPAREVYGFANRLVDVLKFMDPSKETLQRFCSLVAEMDPNSKSEDSALQKLVTHRLQRRSQMTPLHQLRVELAYRIHLDCDLPIPSRPQMRPRPSELKAFAL